FFFQAEDGIRDGHVTGVQTCALPIFLGAGDGGFAVVPDAGLVPQPTQISGSVVQTLKAEPPDGGCLCNTPCAEHYALTGTPNRRSEERRVGKECRTRG